MFFYIGDDCQYLEKVHNKLYLDKGWNQIFNENNIVWYKGYSTECNLHEAVNDIITKNYKPVGKWTIISYDGNYKLFFPVNRGTPLFTLDNNVTNIKIDGFTYKVAPLEYTSSQLDYETVVNNITNILSTNISNYYNFYNETLNVWFTGGVDSLSIIGILEYTKIPYKIYVGKEVVGNFVAGARDFAKSITEYETSLSKKCQQDYWGYGLLSIFNEKITLVTGFYGDEYVLRGPDQLNWFANLYGKTIIDYTNSNQYMYHYLNIKNIKSKFLIQNYSSEEECKKRIKNTLARDHQIWHLDNITTFSPYFDEKIVDSVLSLSPIEIINKSLNIDLQKDIIKKCKPDLLLWLDNFKNTKYNRINFFANRNKVMLNYCSDIQVV